MTEEKLPPSLFNRMVLKRAMEITEKIPVPPATWELNIAAAENSVVLDWFRENREYAKSLIENTRASPQASGESQAQTATMNQHGAPVDAQDGGITPASIAADIGNVLQNYLSKEQRAIDHAAMLAEALRRAMDMLYPDNLTQQTIYRRAENALAAHEAFLKEMQVKS